MSRGVGCLEVTCEGLGAARQLLFEDCLRPGKGPGKGGLGAVRGSAPLWGHLGKVAAATLPFPKRSKWEERSWGKDRCPQSLNGNAEPRWTQGHRGDIGEVQDHQSCPSMETMRSTDL